MFHKVLKNEEERWALCWRFINASRRASSRDRFAKTVTEEDKKIFHAVDVVEEELILSMFGYAEADEPYDEKNTADDIREHPLHFPVIVTVMAHDLHEFLDDQGTDGTFVVDYIEQREFEVLLPPPPPQNEKVVHIRIRAGHDKFPYGPVSTTFTSNNVGKSFHAVRSCMNYYKLICFDEVYIHVYDCYEE